MIDHTFIAAWRAMLLPGLLTLAVIGGALTIAFRS